MRPMSTPAESCRSGADGRAGLPGRAAAARLPGVSPGVGCYRRPWDTPGRATRQPGRGRDRRQGGELDMLWPPVRCGGRDRGMPPVGRFDTQLGLLLVIVPALLLRMLAGVGVAVLGGTAASAIIATG